MLHGVAEQQSQACNLSYAGRWPKLPHRLQYPRYGLSGLQRSSLALVSALTDAVAVIVQMTSATTRGCVTIDNSVQGGPKLYTIPQDTIPLQQELN